MKNKLKSVVVSVNRSTSEVNKEIIEAGVPKSTYYKYLNNADSAIISDHINIIMRVTGCKYDDLIVSISTEESTKFNLSK